MKWINAEKVIHAQIYDVGCEECSKVEMTIEEFLDAYTDEGCPAIVAQPEQPERKIGTGTKHMNARSDDWSISGEDTPRIH